MSFKTLGANLQVNTESYITKNLDTNNAMN